MTRARQILPDVLAGRDIADAIAALDRALDLGNIDRAEHERRLRLATRLPPTVVTKRGAAG